MTNGPSNENTGNGELRLEKALCTSELSYRRLFEAAQDGILILDAATGTHHRCKSISGEFAGFFPC